MNKVLLYFIFITSIITTAQNTPQSLEENSKIEKIKLYKKDVHASYYHDKFNGRKTASGKKFDNSKLTAAHRNLPFGTKLKITNEINSKCVIVEITDRGPFIKGREIDLSKRAFMDITSNKRSGAVNVTIEIIEN
jgi:rare lipoprotein A